MLRVCIRKVLSMAFLCHANTGSIALAVATFSKRLIVGWSRHRFVLRSEKKRIPVFSLIRTRGSYFFSAPLSLCYYRRLCHYWRPCCYYFRRQFGIFSNISAHQMPRNVHCTHQTACMHMPAYECMPGTLHTLQHVYFINF